MNKIYCFFSFLLTYVSVSFSMAYVDLDKLNILIQKNTQEATHSGVYAGFKYNSPGDTMLCTICSLLYKDVNIIIRYQEAEYPAHTSGLIIPLFTILENNLPNDKRLWLGYFPDVVTHILTAQHYTHKDRLKPKVNREQSYKQKNPWNKYSVKSTSW